jgi:hypothetical protein
VQVGSRRVVTGQQMILRWRPGIGAHLARVPGCPENAGATASAVDHVEEKERGSQMAFDDDLKLVGFRLAQERRDGTRTFALSRNRFLTYWLHIPPAEEETALFTWEFAIGEYMDEYGLQVGSNEPLNQYLFPQTDTEVDQDLADVVKAMDRAEAMFAGMNFGHRG